MGAWKTKNKTGSVTKLHRWKWSKKWNYDSIESQQRADDDNNNTNNNKMASRKAMAH